MSWGHGYLENSLYCRIDNDVIQVALQQEEWMFKCNGYVAALNKRISDNYKDLISVQSYIYKKQDVDYWKWVKDNIISTIRSAQTTRDAVYTTIDTFKKNLLSKMKEYLEVSNEDYTRQLANISSWLTEVTNIPNSIQERLDLINEQIELIDKLLKSDTLEEFFSYTGRYVYLKKQIAWSLD